MPKELTSIIAQINKTYGEDTVTLGSKTFFKAVPRISSGVFALDAEMGGGWPRSRIHHIYGPKSSGKSFLCYKVVANSQRICHWCSVVLERCTCKAKDPIVAAWVDAEFCRDLNWEKRLGVDPELFLASEPNTAEQVVDIVDYLIRSGHVGVVVLDSVAALMPADQLEKSAEEGMQPGSVARLMALGCRKWLSALNTKQKHPVTGKQHPNMCTVFLINQLRESISRVPMPAAPPGGRAIRFFSSIELELKFARSDMEMTEETTSGKRHATAQTINFFTEKNKTFPPKREGSFTIDFENASIDNDFQIFDYAVRFGVVKKSGPAHYIYGAKKMHGQDKAFQQLLSAGDFPKIATQVRELIRQQYAEKVKEKLPTDVR